MESLLPGVLSLSSSSFDLFRSWSRSRLFLFHLLLLILLLQSLFFAFHYLFSLLILLLCPLHLVLVSLLFLLSLLHSFRLPDLFCSCFFCHGVGERSQRVSQVQLVPRVRLPANRDLLLAAALGVWLCRRRCFKPKIMFPCSWCLLLFILPFIFLPLSLSLSPSLLDSLVTSPYPSLPRSSSPSLQLPLPHCIFLSLPLSLPPTIFLCHFPLPLLTLSFLLASPSLLAGTPG